MVMIGPGTSGNWVRTKDERSAKLYMQEQGLQTGRRTEPTGPTEPTLSGRQFRRELWRMVRGLFSRSSRRSR